MGYDPVTGIGTGCWPGMKRLAEYMFNRFGGSNLGCYNPASKAGGGPSLHAEGRAQDFGFNAFNDEERAAGDAMFTWAVTHAEEIGLQETLWRGAIWFYPRRNTMHGWDSFQLPGVYGPVQQRDHMSHVHLGVDKHAGMHWDISWLSEEPAPPPTEEDEMAILPFPCEVDGTVYLYDPNTNTRTAFATPAELKAWQDVATIATASKHDVSVRTIPAAVTLCRAAVDLRSIQYAAEKAAQE